MNRNTIKALLEAHDFEELFCEHLGWEVPENRAPFTVRIAGGREVTLQPVAHKRGFLALHCPDMFDAATRAKVDTAVARNIREHLIIFTESSTGVSPVNLERGTGVSPVNSTAGTAVPHSVRQRWHWTRRTPGQPLSRKEHEYLPQQPMLLIEKIGYLEVPLDEEDQVDLVDVLDRVKNALDIDRVTKRFYERFKKEHDAFLGFIEGIADMGDAKWYASVMLNRLMFIYFIQKKGFLDADADYLRNRLARVQAIKGKDRFHTFYRYFLKKLCHEVLAKKDRTLDRDLAALVGNVPYLNGGIFQPHEIEEKYGDEINIPDEAFEAVFDFFDQYEWHLDNRPTANADEINPDVLGYIFEKYINQKQMGAYYTKEDITEYISKNTILPCLFDKAQKACPGAFKESSTGVPPANPERGTGVPPVDCRHSSVISSANSTAETAVPRYFNPNDELAISRRNLPHWEQEQSLCFITFRLGDALPADKLKQWEAERDHWFRAHPKPWSEEDIQEYAKQFPERLNQWLDAGHGSCLLQDPENAQIVESALRHFDGQRYTLFDYVIMPNHVHVLVQLENGETLSKLLHSWKSFTAHEIKKRIKCEGGIWQDESYDHIVRSETQLYHYKRYIAENPAKLRPGTYILHIADRNTSESSTGVPPVNAESGTGVPPVDCEHTSGAPSAETTAGTAVPLSSVWKLLQADPDRYIYPAVRHGVSCDIHSGVELAEPVPYPPEIEVGLDTSKPDLLERRKQWNTPTPPEAGLPTEIWRETVARRQRYAEVRGKLERGDVRDINDLITLNLDIRQFAQDVIERCESPDLLNAIWVALAGRLPQNANEAIKPGITVLDPTCGSGAFLFAALNILEPLYEACLDRMQGFLNVWESSTGVPPVNSTAGTAVPRSESRHPNYQKFFRSILDGIEKHPSRAYFVYKSIIIHNLFGVDIMKEAVEICKLRLFLKLVAQVEEGTRIEPLPDIDFNIRAGNTLVGFATQDEMKAFFDRETGGQALLQFDNRLNVILEQAEDCDRHFNLFRQAQLDNDTTVNKAKARLAEKLATLNDRLNQYLAQDYGVPVGAGSDRGKSDRRSPTSDLSRFLESHQPFHWFVEFYGIMKSGGFDAIIGNPPYLDLKQGLDYQVRQYKTIKTKNLYPLVMERCLPLSNEIGRLGVIVPVSSISTEGYSSLQDLIFKRSTFLSSFDDRPARLFDGLEHIQLTIHLIQNAKQDTPIHSTTECLRWSSVERDNIFPLIEYEGIDGQYLSGCIPKIGTVLEHRILEKVWADNIPLVVQATKTGTPTYYSRKVHNFLQALDFVPKVYDGKGNIRPPSELKSICTETEDAAKAIFCILNSTLFRWFINVFSDCRHVNKREVDGFRCNLTSLTQESAPEIHRLADKLTESLDQNAEYRDMRFKHDYLKVQCIIPRKSKPIIDEIDKVLAQHYGFTEEELDYIINYDIKYRMGKDLQEDGE